MLPDMQDRTHPAAAAFANLPLWEGRKGRRARELTSVKFWQLAGTRLWQLAERLAKEASASCLDWGLPTSSSMSLKSICQFLRSSPRSFQLLAGEIFGSSSCAGWPSCALADSQPLQFNNG